MKIRHENIPNWTKERYGKSYRPQWSHLHNKKVYYFYAISDTESTVWYVTVNEVEFNTYEIVSERVVEIKGGN